MSKVLVSDYDKTFYINNDDIEKNKKNVEKFRDKENLFIIATGRSFLDFKSVVNKYNIKYDYVILNHGATILDSKNNIISNIIIDNSILHDLKNDLNLTKAVEYFCCSKLDSRTDFEHKDLTKINVKYNSTEEVNNKLKQIVKKYSSYINVYKINNYRIEIISNKTSKYHGVEILSNKLEIKKDDIYTIGDGYSDIEMVKNFNGYCMKNSVDELKSIAKKEYNSVSELIDEIK